MTHPSIRGRGAAHNPPNRFDPISVERDEWTHAEDPAPETRFYRDATRSIIATNDSPDVGFDASINPYRGCEHGCLYCMDGETSVLMADGTTRSLGGLNVGDEIYGTTRQGFYRTYARTLVLAHWETNKPAYRVTLEDGTELVAGGDHRFLTVRGWKFVTGKGQGRMRRPHLTTNDRLLGVGGFAVGSTRSTDYRRGYLCGMIRGEGHLATKEYRRSKGGVGRLHQFRLGFDFALERVEQGRNRPITVVRVRGGLKEHPRFFYTADPAILTKRNIEGRALTSQAGLRVISIEPIGKRTLFDITTGTGDFIANGVVSHNCYARPTHEFFGLSAGLDFESKIFVKEDADELLRRKLSSPKWEPKVLAMSGVTDPYQPVERRLQITRRCLEVLAEFRNPVAIVTKNHLVTRDIDLLQRLALHRAAVVNLSVTTLRRSLQRVMEPRTSIPQKRLEAIRRLSNAGIPVRVMVAPVIPGLTDHEMPAILERAADAGAVGASWIMLRLPHAVKDLFEDWLGRHFPDRKGKVLNRLLSLRGGRLNDPRFGSRMRGDGPYAEQVRQVFEVSCRKHGLNRVPIELSTEAFRPPAAMTSRIAEEGPQLPLL